MGGRHGQVPPVCRGFYTYAKVQFMAWSRKEKRLLARTLHTGLHLQEFLRELVISPWDDDDSQYNWFPALASLGNLHSLGV
jgi:hypothetical protein